MLVKKIVKILLLLSLFNLTSCWESDSENMAEDVGEKMEEMGESASEAVEEMGESASEAVEETQEVIEEASEQE